MVSNLTQNKSLFTRLSMVCAPLILLQYFTLHGSFYLLHQPFCCSLNQASALHLLHPLPPTNLYSKGTFQWEISHSTYLQNFTLTPSLPSLFYLNSICHPMTSYILYLLFVCPLPVEHELSRMGVKTCRVCSWLYPQGLEQSQHKEAIQ